MKTKTLDDVKKAIKNAMLHSDTGPLVLAQEVIELANNWENFREEAGGLTVTEWITREMGNRQRNIAFFQRRQNAVDELGEDIRRRLHHEVAVYVIRSVPKQLRQQVKTALVTACIDNNHNPLSPKQARRVIRDITGEKYNACQRHRCMGLEIEIERLNAEINHLRMKLDTTHSE